MLPKLGIIAGSGQLPIKIIDACKSSNRAIFVIALEGQTPEATVSGVPHMRVRLGAAGKIINRLRAEGVADLVLAGGIRRPSLLHLRPDWWAIKFLIKSRAYGAGDDGLLQAIVHALEIEEGFRIVSPDSIVEHLLAQSGFISTEETDLGPYMHDIQIGIQAARELGRRDEGQAAIVRNGRVVALENEAGTDALLKSLIGNHPSEKPIPGSGVLIKMAKPQQENRVDLPTIGPDTVSLAAAAGLAGIVIEASRSLIIDQEAVCRLADSTGLFVRAMESSEIQGLCHDDSSLGSIEGRPAPLICVIAGEASGDQLGAALINGIKGRLPNARLVGVGGPLMQQQGLDSIFPMEELSVMGVAEILPRLPRILRRIRDTVKFVIDTKPSVVVTIDSPDFCFRVAKHLKETGIPLVHYVAPSVWAWRPKRARKIASLVNHVMAILPFEPPYFEEIGLPCTFVGHPVTEIEWNDAEKKFRRNHGIPHDAQVIAVLPGSRKGEVTRLLPIFLKAIRLMKPSGALKHIVVTTVDGTDGVVRAALRDTAIPVTIIKDQVEKMPAMAACDVAIAASGTVALELARAEVPTIIAYRVNPLTAMVLKRVLKIPYVSLINILEEREVMPEYLQERCTPTNIANALEGLLTSTSQQDDQKAGFASALGKLAVPGDAGESIAADTVIRLAHLHTR